MHLYLIRHADALPLGHEGITSDADRPLSPEGRAQCPLLAEALTRLEVRLDLLLTSPLVRAQQTAELLREHLSGYTPDVLDCPHLVPGSKRRKLTQFVKDHEGEHVGLVGHNPDLSIYLSWLIGSKAAQVELVKAGVAHVEFEGHARKRSGTLTWLVTPAWCALAMPPAVPRNEESGNSST